VVSVLIQEQVEAEHSGRAVSSGDDVTIRGVAGAGDAFMLGDRSEEPLPARVEERVREAHAAARTHFGLIGIEWVFDGALVWILQMNAPRAAPAAHSDDAATDWIEFPFVPGAIDAFRHEVESLRGTTRGISVRGNVSPLSHLGEIAELAGVPVRFLR